jgi:hypothetical protein
MPCNVVVTCPTSLDAKLMKKIMIKDHQVVDHSFFEARTVAQQHHIILLK